MTRDEAIQWLQRIENTYIHGGDEAFDKSRKEALHMAIEALKQVTGKLNNPDNSLLTIDSEACKEQKSKLDLISRAEAIEAIKIVDWYHQNSNKDMVHGANSDEHQAWYKAEDIYEALEAVPSADRPRGEWKSDEYEIPHCSECDCINNTVYRNYCPNCGADMRGEDE